MKPTPYKTLLNRIKSANRAELERLESRITRHYEAGTITASELSRLDGKIMHKLAVLSL